VADLSLDPNIVEEQVRKLNRQADSLGLLGVVLALPVGAVIGGMPLVADGPIPSKYGIATLLLGALLAGLLGYMLGNGRAFGYRLRAQLMLGQLRLEQNVEALLVVTERPAPVAALAAPGAAQIALPEPPRIEEIIEAGLAMPEPAPLTDYTPTFEWSPAQDEEVAPVPAVEPEEFEPLHAVEPEEIEPLPAAELEEIEPLPAPKPMPDLAPAPSWAEALEEAMAAPAPSTAPVPEPEPVSDLAPAPSWAAALEQTIATTATQNAAPAAGPEPTPS
jgi:hypothetical protein